MADPSPVSSISTGGESAGNSDQTAAAVSVAPVAETTVPAAGAPTVAASEEDQQARTLIVNYLPQRISESELGRMFEPYGTVEHVKLMLDRRTHVSMGYGFVRFASIESTDRAIAALNGTPIDNKTLRVSHSRPPTAQETNLYVGNIEPTVTREALAKLFAPFGKVIEAKVLVDHVTGQGKGYGFVRMERREECDGAIASLQSAILPSISSRGLAVRYHRPSNSTQSAGRRMGGRGLSAASVPGAGAGGAGGAAAAAMYSMYQMASPYMSMMTMPFVPGPVPGLVIQQQPAQRQTFQGVCVFVYNLPQDTDPNMLRRLFASANTNVISAKVMRNADGRCRGFGFVNVATMDEALQAISSLNGVTVGGKTLQVSLKTDKQQQTM